jgi:heavy metal sensor kinase
MFLKQISDMRHTLALRLALWYAAIFTVSTGVAFMFFYLLITSVIRERTDQELLNQVGQLSTILNLQGIDAVKRVAILEAQAAGVKKIFFRLLYPSGDVFSSSNMSYWQNIGIHRSAIGSLLTGQKHVFETIVIPDRKHKIRILYGIIGPGIILQLGQSMENYTRFIEAFQRIFTATMALLIVLATVVGWFMARRALSGVEVISRTARNISGGALNTRVPVKSKGDEIDQLAITFNQMLDRIQTLVTGIKEMSDNIAHDLRSPITRIRGIAEVTLTTGKTMTEYENMAASTIEECDRLLDMINTMLVISKTEAGVNHLDQKILNIPALVGEACELFNPMAEDKGLILYCNTSGMGDIMGDPALIQRMISNLLDNAIKYTPSGGKISIDVQTAADQNIVISLQDTGIGISPDELAQIFNRFYRGDHSRSKPGIGLGLSLARTIARAHGGDVTVSSQPGQGSTFTVTLPRLTRQALE